MQIVKYLPKDEADWLEKRSTNLNSTEVSCLFHSNPYMSLYELWHIKKDPSLAKKFIETERTSWGKRLEKAIAQGLAEENEWTLRTINTYAICHELKLGSSFDFQYKPKDSEESVILEVKNVDSLVFKNNWVDDGSGNIEAPAHIELQAQHQLLMAKKQNLTLGVLIGGNKSLLLDRQENTKIQELIIEESDKFWWSIDKDKPPKPDFDKDSEFIIRQYQDATEGKIVELDNNEEAETLVNLYSQASQTIKEAEAAKEIAKAKLLQIIKDSEKATHPKFSISAKTTKETQVSFTRSAYRNFRIYMKKEREE